MAWKYNESMKFKNPYESRFDLTHSKAAAALIEVGRRMIEGEERWYGLEKPGIRAIGIRRTADCTELLVKLTKYNPDGGTMRYPVPSVSALGAMRKAPEIRWFVQNYETLIPMLDNRGCLRERG